MSQDLSSKLLDSSKRQFEETKRYSQGAADKGELTRSQAQMQSKQVLCF